MSGVINTGLDVRGGWYRCTAEIAWLSGCFGFNGPLRQYFSLYRAVSQKEGERGEKMIEER